jgi:hypothetical protein
MLSLHQIRLLQKRWVELQPKRGTLLNQAAQAISSLFRHLLWTMEFIVFHYLLLSF